MVTLTRRRHYMKKLKVKLLSLHKSLTNWFNAVGVIYLQTLLTYPEFTNYLDQKGLFYVIIIGNVILRVFKTTKAIEDK